jgi:hypothetical protein
LFIWEKIEMEKLALIKTGFPEMVRTLNPTQMGKWGKMNTIQMVEHMSESIRVANGKLPLELQQSAEQTAKNRSFMLSEKPFRENTPNPLLPNLPPDSKHRDLESALTEYVSEVNAFLSHFSDRPELKVTNPFFGDLNFDEWVHLLHKHVSHHLRQFNLIP